MKYVHVFGEAWYNISTCDDWGEQCMTIWATASDKRGTVNRGELILGGEFIFILIKC